MSDGCVTVGHCIEGLPISQLVWELLLCAFMACFWLGAMNEPTPFAMGLISTDWSLSELRVEAVLAVLSIGNAISLVLFGWLADRYGRALVMRSLLLLTIAAGLFVQGSRSLELTLWARFLIGLCSGGIMAVLLTLVAELLPAQGRGFYLTVWSCGRPIGALFAVIVSCLLPQMQWTSFIFLLMLPPMVLYILCRLDVIPESPRFLYLAGKREEGYYTLLDMYNKEALCLPWAPESISLTNSPDPEVKTIGLETLHYSDATNTAFLCLIVFFINCASQCMRAWMPMTALTTASQQNPLVLITFPFSQAHLGGGPGLSLLQSPPDHHLVMVVAQGYMLEICGIVLCAAASFVISRRWLIRGALVLAACLSFATTSAERHHMWFSAGPLYGAVLMAQSAALNFILVYTCERFPTSSRASAVGLVLFFGQVAQLFMPAMGVVLLRHLSDEHSVLSVFNSLYLVALLLTFQLPLPSRERPLHDIDEGKAGKDARRKRLGASYQSV